MQRRTLWIPLLSVCLILCAVAYGIIRLAFSMRDGLERYDANERLWTIVGDDHPDLAVVRALLDRGASPNFMDASIATFDTALQRGDLRIIRLLIEHGADVNGRSPAMIPLNGAAASGNPEIVAMLFAHGARVDSRDIWGKTPLQLAREGAAESRKKHDASAIARYARVIAILSGARSPAGFAVGVQK